MKEGSIYQDIAKRTGGDIYVGVVGPVRTGKSTFIKRFMESAVLPSIENEYDRARTLDCMPQGAEGKTVMTTEPKLVPEEAVRISVGEGCELNVKLIDCVGYMVEGALGANENGEERMINTPWSEEPIPFTKAAETGTAKVIGEHSTIGILVTSDGTITDIDRAAYVNAEERCARELLELGKPFCIVLNSRTPKSAEAQALAIELEEKYGVPVALVAATALNAHDVYEILGLVLGEFPINELKFKLPKWAEALDEGHEVREGLYTKISDFVSSVNKIGDITEELCSAFEFTNVKIDAGVGTGTLDLTLSDEVFYNTVYDLTGLMLSDKLTLLLTLKELSETNKKFSKIKDALCEAEESGYGIVIPEAEDMSLCEPRIVKEAQGYGVRVSAEAETIHIIKAGIKAEICPVIGTRQQAEEVQKQLAEEYEEAPEGILDYTLFGKTMYDLVRDGMNDKLMNIPPDAREKLSGVLERIINEGAGGLICILL